MLQAMSFWPSSVATNVPITERDAPIANYVPITDRNAFWGNFSLKSFAKDVFTSKIDFFLFCIAVTP